MQDANECWTQIVRMLQQKLPAIKPEENGDHVGASAATAGAGAAKGFIDQYFGEWTWRILHGKVQINISFRVLKNISRASTVNEWNIFQYDKRVAM